MNEPSLRKFLPDVEPGGIVLYNSEEPFRKAVRARCAHHRAAFHQAGRQARRGQSRQHGDAGRAAGSHRHVGRGIVAAAIKQRVKNQRWFDLDMAAIAAGRREIRQGGGA